MNRSSTLNIQRYASGTSSTNSTSSEDSVKLVAIHGLGSGSTAWNLIRPELSKHLEFITIDLPGHGQAEMKATEDMDPVRLGEIIKDELIANGIEQFHLIGNSLGGWICFEMAAKFPTHVQSVTGVAPAGLWLKAKTHRNGELAISRYIARATYRFANQIAHFKFMRAIGFKLVSPKWESFSPETCANAAVAMGSATGYYQLWDAFLGNRFDKPISESIPVTVLFGDTDYTLPVDSCQERTLAPDHADWIILPNSGHAPMWDSVDAVVAETLNTVKKVI